MSSENNLVRNTALKYFAIQSSVLLIPSVILIALQSSKKINLSNREISFLVAFAVCAVLLFAIIARFKGELKLENQNLVDAEGRATDAEKELQALTQRVLGGNEADEQLDQMIKWCDGERLEIEGHLSSTQEAGTSQRSYDDTDLTSKNDQFVKRLQDGANEIKVVADIKRMLTSCKAEKDLKLFGDIVSKIQDYFPKSPLLDLPIVKVFSEERFYDAPEPSVDSEQQSKGMRQRSKSLSNLNEVVVSDLLLNRNSGLDK